MAFLNVFTWLPMNAIGRFYREIIICHYRGAFLKRLDRDRRVARLE